MGDKNMATGSFTQNTTKIAVDIEVGFVPKVVKVVNWTDGKYLTWNDQMEAAHGIVENSTGGKPYIIHAGGITVINGDNDSHQGFTIGLDTAGKINVASKVILWEAYR